MAESLGVGYIQRAIKDGVEESSQGESTDALSEPQSNFSERGRAVDLPRSKTRTYLNLTHGEQTGINKGLGVPRNVDGLPCARLRAIGGNHSVITTRGVANFLWQTTT